MNHFCIFSNAGKILLVEAGGAVISCLLHVVKLLSDSRPYILSYFSFLFSPGIPIPFFFFFLTPSLYMHVLLHISNSNGGVYAFN